MKWWAIDLTWGWTCSLLREKWVELWAIGPFRSSGLGYSKGRMDGGGRFLFLYIRCLLVPDFSRKPPHCRLLRLLSVGCCRPGGKGSPCSVSSCCLQDFWGEAPAQEGGKPDQYGQDGSDEWTEQTGQWTHRGVGGIREEMFRFCTLPGAETRHISNMSHGSEMPGLEFRCAISVALCYSLYLKMSCLILGSWLIKGLENQIKLLLMLWQ